MVVGCPANGCSIIIFVVVLHACIEIVAFDEEFRFLARVHAKTGTTATVVVIEHMDFSNTRHRHTLVTSRSPPVEGESSIEVRLVLIKLITTICAAYEVGVLMLVGAIGIIEGTPTDGVEVGFVRDVEVTVHTIFESTMVYPDVLSTQTGQ